MVSHPCNAIVAQALPVVNMEFFEGRKSAGDLAKRAFCGAIHRQGASQPIKAVGRGLRTTIDSEGKPGKPA